MTGEEMKRIRKKLNVTQHDWGRLGGVSRQTVAKWEVDEAVRTRGIFNVVCRIARFLDRHPGYLFEFIPEVLSSDGELIASTKPDRE